MGLEYLQRRRLHNLPGQPVPGLRHPQREEVLPHVQSFIYPQAIMVTTSLWPNFIPGVELGLYDSPKENEKDIFY